MDEKKEKNKKKEKVKRGKVVFKPYSMDQLRLPMSLDDLIPENHLVRVVNSAIEGMSIEPLLRQYKGGGTVFCKYFFPVFADTFCSSHPGEFTCNFSLKNF